VIDFYRINEENEERAEGKKGGKRKMQTLPTMTLSHAHANLLSSFKTADMHYINLVNPEGKSIPGLHSMAR